MRHTAALAGIALAIALTAHATPATSQGINIQTSMVQFCGQLMNGELMSNVVTTLTFGDADGITGTYSFTDSYNNNKTVHGTLKEARRTSGFTRSLTWTDKFGTGVLNVKFDDTVTAFNGYWGATVWDLTRPWYGTVCHEPLESELPAH